MDLDKPFLMDDEQLEDGLRSLHQRYDVRTICNVFRRIHLTAKREDISQLCAEGIYMAKHMDTRLRHYKKDWDKQTISKGVYLCSKHISNSRLRHHKTSKEPAYNRVHS